MANILSLHQRRVFLPSGDDARYAKLYVSATGTNTAVDTFSDEALSVQQSRPVQLSEDCHDSPGLVDIFTMVGG